MKKIVDQLNFIGQCKKNGIPLWQCPQFLFLIMGTLIFIATGLSYLIGAEIIEEPEIVALTSIIVASVLLVIAFVITRSFERIAEASRLKSEFVRIVSDQLHSPLMDTGQMFELLSSGRIDSLEKETVYDRIEDNIDRMVDLVDDLLVVSRIEEGTFSVNKRPFQINDLVRDLVGRYKVFADSSNIKLSFDSDDNVTTIVTDPALTKLVIESLIDNSIRHTRGGGRIEIKIGQKDKEIMFSVKDEGVGIPDSDKKFIFKKFFRGENALKSRARGSGLGLYVCRQIVAASGGRIWFESKVGQGTTIHFTIPVD